MKVNKRITKRFLTFYNSHPQRRRWRWCSGPRWPCWQRPRRPERPANDGRQGGGGSAGTDRQGSSVGRLAATGENGRSAKPLSALPACSSQRSLAALRMLAGAFQLHHTLKLFVAGFGRPDERATRQQPVPASTHRKPASSRCKRQRKTQRPTRRGRELCTAHANGAEAT